MDLSGYRASSSERERTADLLRHMPTKGRNALDIGARDGHFSLLMADRFDEVTALDLTEPMVSHPKVRCVKGDAAEISVADDSYNFVLCAEVLEHIPPPTLQKVCQEMERVCSHQILIGVPYKQDTRVDRTTCYTCGKPNPPWGHVNSFDEQRILNLFCRFELDAISFVGINRSRSNWLATALMDFAGNPYGTYGQGEACIHCGHRLIEPPLPNPVQRAAAKGAHWSRWITELLVRPRGNWMHILLRKINTV